MSAVSTWQAGFLAVLPAVQTHAKIQFRHLPPCHREDAIQEAIASACASYQSLAARGRLHVAHPGTLATFALNFVRNGRHVGGHQDAAKDVLSPVAQRRHSFACRSADWRQVAIAERRDPIPDTAAFRIDFAAWLKSLTRRDRRIIAAFLRGEGTGEVAERFGITAARVSQLRRRYEREWGMFQRQAA